MLAENDPKTEQIYYDFPKQPENGAPQRIAAIGGTFDALHAGHIEYIRLAFEFATKVFIYLTSDDYVNSKKIYRVQKYETRLQQLKEFLNRIEIRPDRYEIRKLEENSQLKKDYLTEEIDLAITTHEYYRLFQDINQQRMAYGKNAALILLKERTRDHRNRDLSSTTKRSGQQLLHPNSSNGNGSDR